MIHILWKKWQTKDRVNHKGSTIIEQIYKSLWFYCQMIYKSTWRLRRQRMSGETQSNAVIVERRKIYDYRDLLLFEHIVIFCIIPDFNRIVATKEILVLYFTITHKLISLIATFLLSLKMLHDIRNTVEESF